MGPTRACAGGATETGVASSTPPPASRHGAACTLAIDMLQPRLAAAAALRMCAAPATCPARRGPLARRTSGWPRASRRNLHSRLQRAASWLQQGTDGATATTSIALLAVATGHCLGAHPTVAVTASAALQLADLHARIGPAVAARLNLPRRPVTARARGVTSWRGIRFLPGHSHRRRGPSSAQAVQAVHRPGRPPAVATCPSRRAVSDVRKSVGC